MGETKRSPLLILLAALVAMTACATSPSPDFYVLHAPAAESLVGVERGVSVGVGPIELPAHLNRSQIVTRATPYRLDLSESHQWAEPLKESVPRVIAVNLSRMLESNRVFVVPRRQTMSLDFQVSVDVARFDGMLGEEVMLDARWTLYGQNSREPLLNRITLVTERTDGGDYDALVAASSRALELLSVEIAEAIKARR
ncbi:MAG: hypothetical protein GTO67_00395 [Gammaproteobacteria bacterium]|nr:hypothetical protein [Gammaproteobacteria bacterium]NIN37227.1 hypothetical protein [Gammaproteobacteria bacterium]NIO26085.1 hypothetical protein [Gammaproteobacteria bacterium]NIO66698.1 hypothetical protein [Gammaproteobacteria bacterium]NIP46375.1 membrane integrity-associated transporter subunit PqiC [Gammaproteobacteria bacterium]